MEPAALLLSCLLLAQTSGTGGDSPSPPSGKVSPAGNVTPAGKAAKSQSADFPRFVKPRSSEEVSSAGPLVPVRHDQKKVRHDQQKAPAALWAGLLAEDEVSALDGAEVSLLQAVGRAIGSPRRREVITAYWKLSAALARLAVVSHEAQRIRRLEATSRLDAGGAASGRLQSAGASAEARRREALLEVQLAQASLSSLLADKPTEWRPGDPPHVGVYRTEFERLFATRPAPARLRLLHRSLPKRHEVILARTNAARASVDVLAVAQNAYRQGRGSAAGVLDRMAALREQRMAFIDAVLAYNLEIAEYALAVANPNAPARLLTPMLIKVGTAPDASRTDPDVARSDSRVPSVAFPPASASTRKPHGGATGQPTPADEPLDAASEKTPLKTTPMDRSALMNPRSPQPRDARRRSANKPVARSPGDDSDSDDSDSADSATEADGYEGLRNLPAAKQTEMLSALLHWDRSSSRATPGRPLTLNDCLARAPVAPRRRVLEAYWAARQQAAFAQVLAEQLEHCKMLVYATLSREEQPQSPTAMLDLQAAKDKVAADAHHGAACRAIRAGG